MDYGYYVESTNSVTSEIQLVLYLRWIQSRLLCLVENNFYRVLVGIFTDYWRKFFFFFLTDYWWELHMHKLK